MSWSTVPGATRYWVFRTEGHAGCDYGKTLIAETIGTTYTAPLVANGRSYHYNVVAVGSSPACFGPVSNCVTVVPATSSPAPLAAPRFDFDGDGKANVSAFRPSDGTWYIRRTDGTYYGLAFGQSGDVPAAADYDGDGRSDAAVFRPGVWYRLRSAAGDLGSSSPKRGC